MNFLLVQLAFLLPWVLCGFVEDCGVPAHTEADFPVESIMYTHSHCERLEEVVLCLKNEILGSCEGKARRVLR